MDLHVGYETAPEWPLVCEVDGEPDEGGCDPAAVDWLTLGSVAGIVATFWASGRTSRTGNENEFR